MQAPTPEHRKPVVILISFCINAAKMMQVLICSGKNQQKVPTGQAQYPLAIGLTSFLETYFFRCFLYAALLTK
jgi:hypothetical protein